MVRYHLRFITHAGEVFSTDHFAAEHDERAIAYARTIYRSPIGKGYELWQGDRLVHVEAY